MQWLRLLFVICCIAQLGSAQTGEPPVVPITKEPSHHLVFENEYVRVFKVEVPPHAETLYHQHDFDYVGVILGDSDVDGVRVGEKPVRLQLKDGETRFTKGGFAHKAVNNSDKPFVNVTVELKKSQSNVPSDCCVGQKLRLASKTVDFLIDNGSVRALRLNQLPHWSMTLSGMPHVPHSSGVLAIAMFNGIIADMGQESGEGPGCPCPMKNVKRGDAIWIENDHRYRFHSVEKIPNGGNALAHVITLETYPRN